VTEQLTAEMNCFESLFGDKFASEDLSSKDQKARDEQMKELGRAEERGKKLFGVDYFISSATPKSANISSTAVGGGGGGGRDGDGEGEKGGDKADALAPNKEQISPTILAINELDAYLGKDDFVAAPSSSSTSISPTAQAAGVPTAVIGKGIGAGGMPGVSGAQWGTLQTAVDAEMGAADEVLYRMRALRLGLGDRLRHLDALHSAAMHVEQGPSNYLPGFGVVAAPQVEHALRESQSGLRVAMPTSTTFPATGITRLIWEQQQLQEQQLLHQQQHQQEQLYRQQQQLSHLQQQQQYSQQQQQQQHLPLQLHQQLQKQLQQHDYLFSDKQHTQVRTHIYTHTHIYMHIHMCVKIHLYTCMHLFVTHANTHTFKTFTHVHFLTTTHTHTHTHTHTRNSFHQQLQQA